MGLKELLSGKTKSKVEEDSIQKAIEKYILSALDEPFKMADAIAKLVKFRKWLEEKEKVLRKRLENYLLKSSRSKINFKNGTQVKRIETSRISCDFESLRSWLNSNKKLKKAGYTENSFVLQKVTEVLNEDALQEVIEKGLVSKEELNNFIEKKSTSYIIVTKKDA